MDYLIDREARLAIAKCCQDPDRRSVGNWKDGQNSRWHPRAVRRPDASGEFFTTPEAWEFIAHLIIDHHALKIVPMDTPPNTVGYEITVSIAHDAPDLYVKLTVGKTGNVIGRSFHYSGDR